MLETATDIQLLRAWQDHRNADAFHLLVQRYAQMVYATCRHILKNEADAADVTQECFLGLATTPPEIERSLGGWLHRLATHRALNHLKKEQRRRHREVRFAESLPEFDADAHDDLLNVVDEAIDALPDDLRLPLIAHFLRQQSHQQVAEELGVPRRTVSHRIQRGIELLREELAAKGVVPSVAVLGSFLATQVADSRPLPDGLQARLAKYALAGNHNAVTTSLVGMSKLALALCGLAAVLVVGTVWWSVTQDIDFPMENATTSSATSEPDPLVATTSAGAGEQEAATASLARFSTGEPINTLATLAAARKSPATRKKATARLSGTLRDEHGDPVADALVTAWSQPYRGGAGQEAEVRSDENGTYRFEELALDGRLFVKATTESLVAAPLGPLRLGNRGLAEQDMTLQPAATASGTVVDKENNPMNEDYTVIAYMKHPSQAVYFGQVSKSGTFTISGLPTATFEFVVESRLFRGTGAMDFQERTTLAPGEEKEGIALVTGVPQVLESIARSGGPRYAEEPRELGTIEGVVRDAETGLPLTEYTLFVKQFKTGGHSHFEKSFTGDAGRFQIDTADYRSVELTFSAKGYGPEQVTLYPENITPPRTTVNIAMKTGAVVRGRIVNGTGEAVPGALVFVNTPPGDTGDFDRQTADAQSDDAGRYTLNTLREELARLYVSHPIFAYAWVDVRPNRQKPTEVDISLSKGAGIAGQLTRGGTPMPNHSIMAYQKSARELGFYAAPTDDEGRFRFEHLVPGTYDVYTSEGRRSGNRIVKTVTVEADDEATLDFQFVVGSAELEGIITINGEPPSHSANVALELGGNKSLNTRRANADRETGHYEFTELPAGEATLIVSATNIDQPRLHRRLPVFLFAFSRLNQDINLKGPALSLDITGVGAGQRVKLTLYHDASALSTAAEKEPDPAYIAAIDDVDANGTVVVEALEPGPYQLRATLYEVVKGKREELANTVLNLAVTDDAENRVKIAF